MSKPIVVPLDGSPLAEHALVPAIPIAKALHAGLHLIRVREGGVAGHDIHGQRVLTSSAYFHELSARLQAEVGPGLLTVAELDGAISESVVEYAHAVGARMLIMASRRHDGLHRPVLSSATDKVIRQVALPVLVSGPETTPVERHAAWNCRRILVPLDGSELARQIVGHVADLASGLGARVTLFRAIPQPKRTVGWPAIPFDREPRATREQQDALADLETVAQGLRDTGVIVETRVVESASAPAEAIVHAANDAGADLIALATRGHGGAKRFALGSVAHELIKRVLIPILVLAPDDARDFAV